MATGLIRRKQLLHYFTSAFQANTEGAMLAVPIPQDVARRIAIPGGEPVEQLHITLFYFGDAADIPDSGRQAIVYTALGAVAGMMPFDIALDGTGVFEENEERPLYARVNSPELLTLRATIARAFDEADIDYSKEHEYHPHVTLKYLEKEPAPELIINERFPAPCIEAVFARERFLLSLFRTRRRYARRPAAGQKQRVGSGDYEGVTNSMQKALVKAFDAWSVKVRKAITKAASRGADIPTQERILSGHLRELETDLAAVIDKGIRKAGRVAAGSHVDSPAVQAIIRDEIVKNQALIRENLVPNVNDRILPAIAAGQAFAPVQLRMALNNVRALPAQYGGSAWVAIFEVQKGLGKERERERKAEGLPLEKVRWVLDPRAEHCKATPGYYGCPDLAGEYPGGWDTLPTVPAGNVTCRGNCRCHLEVYRDGEWRRGIYDD